MEAFHELKVNCPYEILEIEDIKISNKPNEHGYLYLKALVDESINFKYAIEASTDDKICIYEKTENQEKTIIFNGTIQNIRTSNVDRLYYMEIEALTSSFNIDIQEKSRSFQDIEMSYDDLIETILRDYKIYSFTQCMDKPQSIGKPLFQYKETDYEFLKRVASHLGLELICDTINTNNVFYFGRPIGRSYEIEDDIDYIASLDVKKYRECLGYNDDFHPTDFFYYEIKSKKVMEIGAKVTFKAKELYINSYEAEYVRGELIFKYKLCRKKGIWQEKLYNEKLNGISLEGKVMEVSGEQVKLHLNIDEAQNQSKAAWFRYAPPTGNLMYSMPIVGTNANLYFPSERSQDPMVIGCVRKNGDSCEKCSNVNNRYFSTESGNNLDMLPDAINFSRPGLSATFNDGGGINLNSSSSLSLNAEYVGLFAGDISIQGQSKVVAEKGSSFISLENDFYNDAGIIMENGSDRAANKKFTDDEPTNGVAKAVTSSIEAAMQAVVGDIVAAVQGAMGKVCQCFFSGEENKDDKIVDLKTSGGTDLKNTPNNVKAKGNAYDGKLVIDHNGINGEINYDLYKDKTQHDNFSTQLKLIDIKGEAKSELDFDKELHFSGSGKAEVKANLLHGQIDSNEMGNIVYSNKTGADVNWMSAEGDMGISTSSNNLSKGGIISLINGSVYSKDKILGVEIEQKYTGYVGAIGEIESFSGNIQGGKVGITIGAADGLGGKAEINVDFSEATKVCSEIFQDACSYIKMEYYKIQYGDNKIFNDKEDEIIDKYFGKPKVIKEDD